MPDIIRSDLDYVLKQIQVAEANAAGEDLHTLVPDPNSPAGLRTVDGSFNHLDDPSMGAADQVFPRMTTPVFRDAADGTSFAQTAGDVTDPEPRLISNLIADQTDSNPAAIAAAADKGSASESGTLDIPSEPVGAANVPLNSLFTIFGQFFDHGLDLVTKGDSGNVFIPLAPDDPLFDAGADGKPGTADDGPNFMVLSRATNQPGPDGQLGTSDDVHEHINQTMPFVDQNQTYTSHPSHEVFLREYALDSNGHPVSTGRMLGGEDGGLATWGDVKAQARDLLGIDLSDENARDVPLLASDLYGKFIPGPNGFVQLVTKGPDGQQGTADDALVEGNPTDPVSTADADSAGHAFIEDMAEAANPVGKIADTDSSMGLANADGSPTDGSFDDESLNAHFIAGDGRANENIGLTAIHEIFHNEHNRLVSQIEDTITATNDPQFIEQWHKDDGSWDGERLFQAARFFNEMQYQHLVFEEFARRVQPDIDEFQQVDTSLDPRIVAEFAHTVYRFGHTMLTDTLPRTAADGTDEDISLVQAFTNPTDFAASGTTPERATGAIVRGLDGQTANQVDEFVTEGVRDNLLGLPLDLAALNIARGRDTGIPPLNEVRGQFQAQAGGDERLAPYTSWEDFGASLRHPESLVNFIAAYGEHPSIEQASTAEDKRHAAEAIVDGGADAPSDAQDFLDGTGAWSDQNATGLNSVDFWIGGLAEAPMDDGLLGPSFNFVFETQLENLQSGDRFYYLNRTAGLNFLNQLEEGSFADLIMRNSDVTHLSLDAFGAGNAVIAGTDGADQLAGTAGDETIYGDAGDDKLEGGAGNDFLSGLDGNDSITDSAGDDVIRGGAGDDRIDSVPGADLILGGAGDDFIQAGEDDEIFGEQGNDIVLTGDLSDEVRGNEGDDWLEGGAGDDKLIGDDKDPSDVNPIAGNDILIGGGGADTLTGEHGNDIFVLGEGNDQALGGTGYDWASFERNAEGVNQNLANTDTFSEVEALSGSNSNDVLQGNDADLTVPNDAGNTNELTRDAIASVTGLAQILGGTPTGNLGNILLGGGGSDTLEGRGGNDFIDGDSFLHVQVSAPAPGGTITREIQTADGASNDVDTAVFSDDFANYDVTANQDGTTTVAHARGTMTDGTDTLRNIEDVQFADQAIDVASTDFVMT
jgi:Ca2+-binding RTX toxin-like protein